MKHAILSLTLPQATALRVRFAAYFLTHDNEDNYDKREWNMLSRINEKLERAVEHAFNLEFVN
jgi:hypothetical protein